MGAVLETKIRPDGIVRTVFYSRSHSLFQKVQPVNSVTLLFAGDTGILEIIKPLASEDPSYSFSWTLDMTILGPSFHARAGVLVRDEPVSGRQDQVLICEMQLFSGRIPHLWLSHSSATSM